MKSATYDRGTLQRKQQSFLLSYKNTPQTTTTEMGRKLVHDCRGNQKWKSGVVQAKTGPVSYRVETGPRQSWRRHTDQIISSVRQQDSGAMQYPTPEVPQLPSAAPQHMDDATPQDTLSVRRPPDIRTNSSTPVRDRRNPERILKAPDRLGLIGRV
jgi:hypothetical protein